MFTPAELIEALRRRLRRSIRPLPNPSGFPPSWQAWFDAIRERHGAGSNARAESLVATLARRDPPPRPVPELLGGWAAFRALWRQQWAPPGRDERGLRVFSKSVSIVLHLLFLIALSLLMHARFMLAPAPDAQRGEHVIEVEFIGSGTPEEDGGGAPPETATAVTEAEPVEEPVPQPLPQPVAEPQPPESQPAPEAVAQAEPEPEPEPPVELPPPAEQPLVVTETPLPEGPFQLPPIRPIDVATARAREIEVAPRTRDVELAEIRELSAPQVLPVEAPQPELAAPEIGIVEREVALPPRTVLAPEVSMPAIDAPEPRPRDQQARVRDIPMPPATGPGEAAVESAVESAGEAAAEQATAQAGATGADRSPEPDPGTGVGPAQVQREGGWTTPQRDDDWGASTRERAGGQDGTASLFNPDGSARLPPGDGRVGGGLPPGTITEDYEKIDRRGTWLKRPPTDYEPTSLDRFWVPHENLLQEWVRRSVRTVLIPIPGTGKSIRCDVVTLAVAGGCSIYDPNLQDEPASARPPPDVPFRPELHEDQQGLSDDAWDQ